MYQNEIAFKKDLMFRLKKMNAHVTPIQTRTVLGVPDLFVSLKGAQGWIECKHVRQDYREGRVYAVPFRAGQQKWAYEHFVSSGKSVLYLIAFNNGVYRYYPTKVKVEGRIKSSELQLTDLKELTAETFSVIL